MTDDFLFADDDDEELTEELGVWKVLIVDDEPKLNNAAEPFPKRSSLAFSCTRSG